MSGGEGAVLLTLDGESHTLKADLAMDVSGEDAGTHHRPSPPRSGVHARRLWIRMTGMKYAVYADFRRQILPYPTGNIHPRFWGWVMGTGTPVAMLAEMLATGMNSWVGGFDQSATLVEEQVVGWLTDMLGFPHGNFRSTDERVHGRKHYWANGCPPRQSTL